MADHADRLQAAQRVVLTGALALTALAFWRPSLDVFNTLKATIAVLGVLAVVATAVLRAARTHRVAVASGPFAWALGGFAVALLVATAVSATPLRSVVGLPGRHTGTAGYLTYAVIAVAAGRLLAGARARALVDALLLAAVGVAAYGLLQAVGADPFEWQTPEGGPQVFSSFGNRNFLAAWLAIVIPLAGAAAADRERADWQRIGAGGIAVVALLLTFATGSAQGPAAALVGLAVLTGCATWPRWRDRAGRVLAAAGVTAVIGVAVVAVAGGPLASLRADVARSLQTRVPKWQTALAMAADRPLLGFGLDTYGDYFFSYRSPAVAAESGLRRSVDNAHNVPLAMLTDGGAVLAGAWLAVMGTAAAGLRRGLRGAEGPRRLLLAGLAGGWAAYLAQALVSIDVPPLAALGFALAGSLAAGGTLRFRDLRVPAGAGTRAVAALAAVAILATAVVSLRPLRADLTAAAAAAAAVEGDEATARARYARAASLAPWEARYPAQAGAWLQAIGALGDALTQHQAALAREPRGLVHALNTARVAAALDRHDRADAAYRRVLTIDPHTPVVLVEVARHHLTRGRTGEAVALLERAVATDSDLADAWAALADARTAAGDTAGADAARDRAAALGAATAPPEVGAG